MYYMYVHGRQIWLTPCYQDEYHQQNQELLVDVDRTLKDLLDREDVDRNHQITIEDNGPKASHHR